VTVGRPEPRQKDPSGRGLAKTLTPAIKGVVVRGGQGAYRVPGVAPAGCWDLPNRFSVTRAGVILRPNPSFAFETWRLAGARMGAYGFWVVRRVEGWGRNKKRVYWYDKS
jgi:hypothetical protein